MAIYANIEEQGFKELVFRVRTADDKVRREALAATRQATRVVFGRAVANAPVKTGRLVRGMGSEVFRPRTDAGFLRYRYAGRVTWTRQAIHGVYQERGTGVHGPTGVPYYQRARAKAGQEGEYFLNPGVPAQWYVAQAIEDSEAEVHAIFSRAAGRIARYIGRG